MLRKPPSPMRHIVTSLKVVALVTVLGTVVLAAERHMATVISPEEIIATDMAPNHVPQAASTKSPTAAPYQAPSLPNTAAPDAYFPSQFPEPKGATEEQPPTF
ncbi:MAG TPA: hypothetical protein VMN79_01640 [Casimicrobiaceae bacterium]|nr:hypothetical protein [Casimicrobiaceae bacterium]